MNAFLSNPLALGLIGVAVLSVAELVLIVVMWNKLKRFLININSENISDSLESVSTDLTALKSFREEIETYLSGVEKRLRSGVRSVHTVRFNPWQGTGEGGAQSFATAFMNEEGDGVVLSSLYSRDHVSIFGKALKNHGSEHELSQEERQAVEEASKKLKKQNSDN